MARVRMNIEFTGDAADFLNAAARKEGTSRAEILYRGLAVLKVYDEQRAQGNTHIGFAADPGGLDAEMVGLFDTKPDQPARDDRQGVRK